MPKKIKDTEDRLKTIEFLLAGILLEKNPRYRRWPGYLVAIIVF